MTRMVRVAVAGDVTEAHEIRTLLGNAGIDAEVEPAPEDDAFAVLVAEASADAAEDPIEAMTEPDEFVSDV